MFKNNKIFKLNKHGEKKRVFFVKGLKIRFKGKNAELTLPYKIKFKNSRIELGNNCKVIIQDTNRRINSIQIFANADNTTCEIGKNLVATCNLTIIANREPNLKVLIGDNCMFGTNVILRTTDSHSIINEKGETINFGGDIIISDNCWLAMDVTVLKNVKIAEGVVVGTGSIVTKNLDTPNAIYVGVPAKLTKTNIRWSPQAPSKE